MRTRSIVVVTSLLLAAACGKVPEPGSATNSAGSQTANMGGPVNIANIPPEFQQAANIVHSKMPANGAVQPLKVEPKTLEVPSKDGPAPDDSDVKTVLGENLVQTRTFHSNPQIAKLEQTTIMTGTNSRTTVKVYLKNGQVKEITLKDALTAPAADILKAIH